MRMISQFFTYQSSSMVKDRVPGSHILALLT